MGAGPSRLVLGKPQAYNTAAKKQSDLFDQITNVLAKNTSFQDMLMLHNLGQCGSYVFATAQAVSTVFQKLQVEPKRGAKGEIYFASRKDIMPGYGTKQIDNETAERIRERDRMCLEIGYNYIRVFQILAALGLTTLNASPVRRFVGGPAPAMGRAASGPRTAVLYGGGRGIAQKTALYQELHASLLDPLLFILGRTDDMPPNQIQFLDSERRPAIKLYWVKPDQDSDTLVLEGHYFPSGNDYPFEFIAERSDTTRDYSIQANGRRALIGRMVQRRGDQRWVFEYDDPKFEAFQAIGFLQEFHTQLQEILGIQGRAVGPVGAAGAARIAAPAAQPGVSQYGPDRAYNIPVARMPSVAPVSGGVSVYEGFDALKTLYDGRQQGKEFPKAYCIGRAMQLLKPIFPDEKPAKDPYFSQICSAQLDFETQGEYLPKPGKTPRANIYFRSLVALYYDDFELQQNKVFFTKTETGNSELADASEKFADLFQVTRDKKGFLESQQQFRGSMLCGKGASAQGGLIPIWKDSVVRELQNKVIGPMLDLQAAHSKRVNEFLKKLFTITMDKSGKIEDLKLSKAIKTGGRPTINQLGREAHDILLDYYLKAEAFYTEGVLHLERSQADLSKR